MADGGNRTQAAIAAGYAPSHAASSGCQLYKQPEVKARIIELQTRATAKTVNSLAVSKTWVLDELIDNIHQAKAAKQFTSANRALELVGKEIGMFKADDDLNIKWTGDIKTLEPGQLAKLRDSLQAGLTQEMIAKATQEAATRAAESPDDNPEVVQ